MLWLLGRLPWFWWSFSCNIRDESHMEAGWRVLRATRAVSSQAWSSCVSFVVSVFFCVVLYKMSFTTDFIALAWGKVMCEHPGHLSSGVCLSLHWPHGPLSDVTSWLLNLKIENFFSLQSKVHLHLEQLCPLHSLTWPPAHLSWG